MKRSERKKKVSKKEKRKKTLKKRKKKGKRQEEEEGGNRKEEGKIERKVIEDKRIEREKENDNRCGKNGKMMMGG